MATDEGARAIVAVLARMAAGYAQPSARESDQPDESSPPAAWLAHAITSAARGITTTADSAVRARYAMACGTSAYGCLRAFGWTEDRSVDLLLGAARTAQFLDETSSGQQHLPQVFPPLGIAATELRAGKPSATTGPTPSLIQVMGSAAAAALAWHSALGEIEGRTND